MKRFFGILVLVLICLLYLPLRLILPYQLREKLLGIFDLPIFHFIGKTIAKTVFDMTDEDLLEVSLIDNEVQNLPIKISAHGSPLRIVHSVNLIQEEDYLVFQQPNDYR